MNANKRKLLVMDLALGLIVLGLFGLVPLTSNSRPADPDLIQGGSDVGSGSEVGTSRIPRSHSALLYRVNGDDQ